VPGDRERLGGFEGGGEQVAGRQAAAWSPFLGDGQDLLLAGEVVQLIDGPARSGRVSCPGRRRCLTVERTTGTPKVLVVLTVETAFLTSSALSIERTRAAPRAGSP
jgi:hypothetical protein